MSLYELGINQFVANFYVFLGETSTRFDITPNVQKLTI